MLLTFLVRDSLSIAVKNVQNISLYDLFIVPCSRKNGITYVTNFEKFCYIFKKKLR